MGISHKWDGTLSTSDFYTSAKFLSDKWKGTYPVLPPWTWVSCPSLFGAAKREIQGYLSLERFSCAKSVDVEGDTGDGISVREEPICSSNEELLDDATLVQNYDQDLLYYDLHIVLHNSYRVPVLYFRGYHCDGQPLASDEIEKGLPDLSSKVFKDSRWTFLTIEEHPFLKRPWYLLHPCGTGEWMKLLLTSDNADREWEDIVHQYLLSWLSVAGQVVGLTVPLELFRSHAE